MANISSLYPTPEEVLLSNKYKLFNDLEVKSYEEFKVPTFTTPKSISKRIHIDPKIPSTRHQLRHPKFPTKSKGGYLKGFRPEYKTKEKFVPVDFQLPEKIVKDGRRLIVFDWLNDVGIQFKQSILIIVNACVIIDYMLTNFSIDNNKLQCYALSSMAISIDIYNGTLELDRLAYISDGSCSINTITKYTEDILSKVPNPRFLTVANYIYKYLNGNVPKYIKVRIIWTILNGTAYEGNTKEFAKQLLKNPVQFLRKKPSGNRNDLVKKMVRNLNK